MPAEMLRPHFAEVVPIHLQKPTTVRLVVCGCFVASFHRPFLQCFLMFPPFFCHAHVTPLAVSVGACRCGRSLPTRPFGVQALVVGRRPSAARSSRSAATLQLYTIDPPLDWTEALDGAMMAAVEASSTKDDVLTDYDYDESASRDVSVDGGEDGTTKSGVYMDIKHADATVREF